MDPFSSGGGFETFDAYGDYEAATAAALYGVGCDPDIDINANCSCV